MYKALQLKNYRHYSCYDALHKSIFLIAFKLLKVNKGLFGALSKQQDFYWCVSSDRGWPHDPKSDASYQLSSSVRAQSKRK